MSDTHLRKPKQDGLYWSCMEQARHWNLMKRNNPYWSVTVAGYFDHNGVPYFCITFPRQEERHGTLAGAMDAAEALAVKTALEGK